MPGNDITACLEYRYVYELADPWYDLRASVIELFSSGARTGRRQAVRQYLVDRALPLCSDTPTSIDRSTYSVHAGFFC